MIPTIEVSWITAPKNALIRWARTRDYEHAEDRALAEPVGEVLRQYGGRVG
jgi:hypothetical protein